MAFTGCPALNRFRSITKKGADHKHFVPRRSVADKEITTPHFDWVPESEIVLNGYNPMPMAPFSVYSIDSTQLADFFTLAGNKMPSGT